MAATITDTSAATLELHSLLKQMSTSHTTYNQEMTSKMNENPDFKLMVMSEFTTKPAKFIEMLQDKPIESLEVMMKLQNKIDLIQKP